MARPSPSSWHAISRLLDEVLDLPVGAREPWLEALRLRDPAAAAAATDWLDEYALVEAAAFLEEGTAAAPLAASLIGTDVGCYRLVERIGEGGMGTVWLAERHDGQFDQRVAIKMLNAGLTDGAGVERFSREAAILARLTQQCRADGFQIYRKGPSGQREQQSGEHNHRRSPWLSGSDG